MCYTLPKIWKGRIQKYWDKIMPSGFPASDSIFTLTFDTPEIKAAVDKFEEEMGTEESVVATLIPEGTYSDSYIGVYNVEGIPGERTLLSPEKISKGKDEIAVLHYNAESDAWENVEDIEVVDGYVWGTLASFSPIAIVSFRKEMHLDSSLPSVKAAKAALVCEGNTVTITENEEGKTIATNMNTGLVIELPEKTYVVGGSVDGSPIKKTNIIVKNLSNNKCAGKIIAGSFFVPADDDKESVATVEEVNFSCLDKVASNVTGSFGAVRTEKVNFKLHNCKAAWIGCGEGFAKLIDIKVSRPSFASRSWAKEVNYDIKDAEISLLYCGQNCEYFYVNSTNVNIDGGKYDYVICGGSNADTNKSVVNIKNAKVGIFQSVNRGDIASAVVNFSGANEIDNLFIGGDATDETVTGTTTSLKYDISGSEGTYNILRGFEAGVLMSNEDLTRIVDTIKVSRSANVTIADELKSALGPKYIIK